MTVQPHQPAALALPAAPSDDLTTWLAAMGDAQQLAHGLVRSFFVPEAFKPRIAPNASPEEVDTAIGTAVANATGAILLGRSLGLDPLTSLQQIYVVHGRPGMYAKLKVALAQSAGHRVTTVERTAERVTVQGQRAGSDDVVTITVTIEDAKRAGWTSNAAYSKTPADMLWARAASRVVDQIAADRLFGIASVEDIDEGDAPAPTPVTSRVTVADLPPAPPATKPQAIERMIAPAPAPAPAQAAQPEPEPDQSAEPEPPIEKLRRELGDAFNRLKVSGPGVRARRARICSDIVGRPIATSLDLTAEEIQTVLDNLTADVVRRIETPPTAEPALVEETATAPWATQPEYDPTADPSDPWADPRATPALDVPGDQR